MDFPSRHRNRIQTAASDTVCLVAFKLCFTAVHAVPLSAVKLSSAVAAAFAVKTAHTATVSAADANNPDASGKDMLHLSDDKYIRRGYDDFTRDTSSYERPGGGKRIFSAPIKRVHFIWADVR